MDQNWPAATTQLACFADVRAVTDQLVEGLSADDQCVQSMPDASPIKWHRAHTTWFWEEFVLVPYAAGYVPANPLFQFLFNSYYDTIGSRQPRPLRGLITRPDTAAVTAYRANVDAAMRSLLAGPVPPAVVPLISLGLAHEQQHQELLVADLLHAFAQNPLLPAIRPGWREPSGSTGQTQMVSVPAAMHRIGAPPDRAYFAFDNEGPQHALYVPAFRIADRLVRNRDWLAFLDAGGYRHSASWMMEGYEAAQAGGWNAPLYWRHDEIGWHQMGPGGLAPLDLDAPVRHISWYEADAYARWRGMRLPSEAEWEVANDAGLLAEAATHVWQWTESAYRPYPGFHPPDGAIGEYSGKFMINQMVLRGGSMATPPGHTRSSYRNFFHPDKRWQFSGLRLAADA